MLIAPAAELGTAPVLAELELVLEVAVREPAAESLPIGQAAARARVIVRGAGPVLAIVPGVELVLVIVLAKAALLIALAEVREPEAIQVEAVPELDRVAVPLRIKSVIAVHHRGPVLLLTAAVDLVVVAQTMREQAATEAATAWGVAG